VGLVVDSYRFAAAASFTDPTDVAGLEVWLDATTGTTGDDPITAWADQSGNGNNAVITAGSVNPQFNPSYQINSSGVLFANNCSLYCPIATVVSDMTIFAVFKTLFGTYTGQIFDIRDNSDTNPLVDDTNRGGFGMRRRNNAGTLVSATNATGNGNANIYRGVVDASSTDTFDYWLNAVLKSSSPAAAGTTTGLDRFYVGKGWTGVLGEILLYNSVLGSTDINNIEDYLAAKWGITL